MISLIKGKSQIFNDGVAHIYEVVNTAADGDKPIQRLMPKRTLRYKERTVGLNRFWTAAQGNVRVAYVLRCQRNRDISTQDIAVPNDGLQYRIVQIQYPEDITPHVMDLTLEEVKQKYEIGVI